MSTDQSLIRETATAIVARLNSGEITPLDLLDALEARIKAVDGKVNALPTLCFDRARARAHELMKRPAGERGLLAGMPVPIKDLTNVAGVLTTQGSPIYKDHVPTRSDICVERIEANGGIVYAKSNTPEFDRTLGVQGPMARNVEDLALLLDAMSGEHRADPLSLPALATSFRSAVHSGNKPKRVAYSPDLGITPVDPEVASITRMAAARFAEAGVIVEEAHPDLREAHECFHVLRALDFAISKAALLRDKRDLLKPEVVWNIEQGLKLSVGDIERAEAQRVAMTARTLAFFETYDLLLAPATIVAAFPIEHRYVAECDGRKFDNYVEWLGIVYAITLVCCPALSLPCGFTASGLPVGLQMIAPPRNEAGLLTGARVLEDILGLRGTTPIDPR